MIFLIIGLVLLVTAGVLWWQWRDARRTLRAMRRREPTAIGDLQQLAAAARGQVGAGYYDEEIEAAGTITASEPLRAPFSGTPCVAYTARLVRNYTSTQTTTDRRGRRETRTVSGSDTLLEDQRRISFELTDSTGTVQVEPEGAQFITVRTLDQQGSDPPALAPSAVVDLHTLIARSAPLPQGARRSGFHLTEEIVPLTARLYVLGNATDRDGRLALRRPLSGGQFIISTKSEQELAHDYMTRIRWLGIGGILTAIAGVIVIIVGLSRG